MNLHEECLLKYLSNPTNLLHTTELLKLNNSLIEKSLTSAHKRMGKMQKINYLTSRI